MRFLILHNPRSGFGSDAIYEFERALLHDGDECLMRIMDDAWDPKQAVQDAALYDCVIISGGDGTIGHLMYALRNTGVPLCVFPSGTANLICARRRLPSRSDAVTPLNLTSVRYRGPLRPVIRTRMV